MTSIAELKAYDTDELWDVYLHRQNPAEDVHKKINEISADKEFLEICDYYVRYVMPNGMGSFRRAGILAIAEKI